MPTTALNLQQLILMRVGEHDNTGPISGSIADLWEMFADKAYGGTRLQYLYTLREALDIKLAALGSDSYTLAGASSIKVLENTTGTDKAGHPASVLYRLRVTTNDEITRLEKQYSASRPPVVGNIARTAPVLPGDLDSDEAALSYTQPDPNSRSLRGDPIYGYKVS